jgi:hypothetical protein
MMVKRAKPVAPEATVKSPKEPAAAAASTAAVDKTPLVATAIVTVFEPAVLSMNKSNTVP